MLKNFELSLDKSLRLLLLTLQIPVTTERRVMLPVHDGGTSGCGSQSLAPPTSGTGLDLSGSDEWMVL